jgi:acetylornithine deacetylase/succinyl-diaminopimelate desuccinylase-like protein
VTYLGGGAPSLTPIDHPATQAAARAVEATFGREPLYIREGGSIPVCASFESILGLPVVLLGFTPPDDNAHAPDEWMDLTNYETGIRTIVRTLDELATLPR